jgi:hypothetical protein
MAAGLTTARFEEDEARSILERPNKGMKLTRPERNWSLAAYPRCSADTGDVAADAAWPRGVA